MLAGEGGINLKNNSSRIKEETRVFHHFFFT